jgi:hypothetical protein
MRERQSAAVVAAGVVLTLVLAAGSSAPAGAAAPQGYAASDVLGQVDGSGNPVFTSSAANNGAGSGNPNSKGVHYPQGTALDTAGHRLFSAECTNDRVLVYTLDATNNLVSRTASFVIGQADFTSTVTAVTKNNLKCPVGPSYDAVHKRLFVPDNGNSRVLEFDLSAGITNGMPASHVLGRADFTSSSCAKPPTAASICNPYGGSQYDPTNDRLFVSDSNDRVLVYDLAGGITDGMNATAELGQPDFATTSCAITRSGLSNPNALAYDAARQLLYVGDDALCSAQHSARVMVWDLSHGITSGMDAAHILGKKSYTDGVYSTDAKAAIDAPDDLSLDAARQHLYAEDDHRSRVLVFDVATITDGQDATAVIGEPDFTTTTPTPGCLVTPAPTRYNICDAQGDSQDFDVANNRMYLSDASHNRVLVFNFVEIDSSLTPDGTVGVTYRAGIQSRSSQGTLTYTVSAGALPPGLSLNPSTGLISGTPTAAGPYSFQVMATDDNDVIGTFTDTQSDFILVASIPVPDSGGGAAG